MTQHDRPRMSEPMLAQELNRLVNLIQRLSDDADLKVEVLTEDRDSLRLTFSGRCNAEWRLQREAAWLPGTIVRRVWPEPPEFPEYVDAQGNEHAEF